MEACTPVALEKYHYLVPTSHVVTSAHFMEYSHLHAIQCADAGFSYSAPNGHAERIKGPHKRHQRRE